MKCPSSRSGVHNWVNIVLGRICSECHKTEVRGVDYDTWKTSAPEPEGTECPECGAWMERDDDGIYGYTDRCPNEDCGHVIDVANPNID